MKQFIVTLRRTRLHENATIGQLINSQTGEQIGVTLEDRDRNLQNGGVKIYGKTCIQPGQYKASRRYWDKVKRKVWGLWGVPKFEGILIHGGATVEDTLGCVLLGTSWGYIAGKETLYGCKVGLNKLDELASNYDELIINVVYANPLTEDTRIK